MLERIFGNFNPEKEVFAGPNIRFHHLVYWVGIVDLYHKKFDKDLWDLNSNELKNVRYRLGKRIGKTTNDFVTSFNKYKEMNDTMHESHQVQTRLRYLTDVLGSSKQTHELVAKKWSDSQLGLVAEVAKNKDVHILLSFQKDVICDSCAEGLHCNLNLYDVLGLGRDTAYQKVLLRMLGGTSYWVGKGEYTILKNNDIVISGELLFDRQFLSVVENNAILRFPRALKGREL